ncbi:MAG TPA: MBL fold metallo-hydrolase, partial [Kineosporiaceae bacterium]|nr:MBL fold metallo-hydrolase [Kineosporiaceae bacterium]
MDEVVDGVLQISLGYVNAYLVVTDDGLVLVDTGLPKTYPKLEQALTEAQRSVGEIRTVLLTHWHTDHTGGLARVRSASGARVVAHSVDAPVVDGSVPPPYTLMMRLGKPLTGEAQTAPVDE